MAMTAPTATELFKTLSTPAIISYVKSKVPNLEEILRQEFQDDIHWCNRIEEKIFTMALELIGKEDQNGTN